MLVDILLFNFFNYPIFFCLFVSIFLAFCGMALGVKNLIRTFISIEVLLLSISFLFIFVSFTIFDNLICQVFALFILALAACESALGLSLLIVFFRDRGLLTSFESLSSLKG